MTRQLPLAVKLRPRPLLDAFVAGPNQLAIKALTAMLDDGQPDYLYLSGAPATGKTHLLLGACAALETRETQTAYLPLRQSGDWAPEITLGMESASLIALDDIDAIAGQKPWEEALFHLFNRVRAAGSRLLVSANRGPLQLDMTLADLTSRLASGTSFHLSPLADDDRQTLLKKLAQARGLELTPEAARWILTRHTRDPGKLEILLDRLDTAALAAQRRLTLPFVRTQLIDQFFE